MAQTPYDFTRFPGDRGALLVEFGFKKKGPNGEDIPDEEEKEILKDQIVKTGYPTPIKGYQVITEVHDLSLEEPYFWILDTLKENFPIIEKLEDSFAAAENSAFFGVSQQRLGAQQEKVSQFLATTGKMIKELFQMVRELRILDERLGYYKQIEEELKKEISQRGKSAEITLKGMFVDLVQQGAKSAASVFGMARELEFVTLPDLFFDAPPFKNRAELEAHIQILAKDFNKNVRNVLMRHLSQYFEWRQRTSHEHQQRKDFMLQYLKQHFEIIKMYIDWVKPYLKHTARLALKEGRMSSPDIISAFEGSMLDIEILGRRWLKGANGCILASFSYRTRPELKVVQEGYQRGPVHIGRLEMNLRVYSWSDKQLENYKKLKDKETIMFMGEVSTSVQSAMESLGKELDKYLEEARGKWEKKEEKTEKKDKKSFAERFFGDFYTPKSQKAEVKSLSGKEQKKKDKDLAEGLEAMKGHARAHCWTTYNNFKKTRGMTAW